MYIDIQTIKKHLNIDNDYHDDDEYLADLEEVCEAVVAEHIDENLKDLCAKSGNGELPAPLKHAILLLIGNFYSNRESVAFASASEIPLSYSYLLDLYKNYYNPKRHNLCKQDN